MLVLVTYDVNTESDSGKNRLRKVAKVCTNYGQRVQNSVFECHVDEGQYRLLKGLLEKEIKKDIDSLRFYRLGNHYQSKVETLGIDRGRSAVGELIF